MPDGFIAGLGRLLPTGQRSLRLRWLRSCHRRQLGRDQGLRRRHQQLERRPEHAGRAQLHGLRLQPRQRQDLPRRRLQHRQRLTGTTRPGSSIRSPAPSPTRHCSRTRSAVPPPGSSTATSTRQAARCRQHHARPHLRLRHRANTWTPRAGMLGSPNNVPGSAVFDGKLWALGSGNPFRASRAAFTAGWAPPRTRRPRS